VAAKSAQKHHISKGSVTYRIEVDGNLNASWGDRFAGIKIRSRQNVNHTSVTILTGRLGDRAELTNVLNGLADSGLPILSVVIKKPIPQTNGIIEQSIRKEKP
jgi:hypothetical protein